MTKYPLREPFYNREHSDRQDLYKKLLLGLYAKEDTLEETPILLRKIYTPLYFAKSSQDKESVSLEDLLRKEQFIAISADAGSGKSTLTKFLSIITSENGSNPTVEQIGKRVVMPIILRELDFAKINSFDELLSQWIDNLNRNLKNPIFDRAFFDFYLHQGWAIMIFDGFDEIGQKQNAQLIEWLNNYIKNHTLEEKELKTNIIITGRPTGFIKDVDYDKNFKRYYILPYNQKQIESYTDRYMSIKYHPNKALKAEREEKFLARLESIKDLNQLKTRPIYLMMLIYISEHKGEIPRSRVLAYQYMTESYLHILDKQRNLEKIENTKGERIPNWDYQDKTIMLEELAYMIHNEASQKGDSKQLRIEISRKQILPYLREIIKDEDEKLRSVAKDTKAEDILDYYLSRSGLLVVPKDGYVQFSHLSFQEYLTASKIYRDKDDLDLIEYLNKEIFDKLDGIGFAEVAQLYFGIDSLKGGKNQFKITQKVFKDTVPYHQFIFDLIFLTENKLKEKEETEWIQTLLYIWTFSKYTYIFRSLIQKLEEYLNDYKSKQFKQEIENFLMSFADEVICQDIKYKPLIKGDELNKSQSMTNILYVGYYVPIFQKGFVTNQRLKSLPKEKNLPFVLDKYIPYNRELKVEIANRVIEDTSALMWVELNGDLSLLYSTQFSDNVLLKDIVKIQFLVNKNMLFLLSKNIFNTSIQNIFRDMARDMGMDRDMARDMARDIARDRDIDMNMARSMARTRTMARDMDMDMNMARRAMSMAMDMDMAKRVMAMARDMDIARRVMARAKTDEVKNLVFVSVLFSLYTSVKPFAKEIDMDIDISKEEYQKLYTKLSANPIEYFEEKEHILDKRRKAEIKELFEKSYLLPTMKNTLENTKYEVFDEERAVEDFHQMIKDFIRENK